jgi:hypothetical protein
MTYPRIRIRKLHHRRDSIILPSGKLKKNPGGPGAQYQALPPMEPLPETLSAEVVIKVGDNISTDSIMPAGNKILPLRSNIDALSEFVFYRLDPDFAATCRGKGERCGHRRRKLWAGFQQGARGPGAQAPGGPVQNRQEFCPNSQGQSVQLRDPAPHVPKGPRTTIWWKKGPKL